MKILFLTPQLPYPPQQGTTIRNYNLLRHIAQVHEVTLVSFGSPQDVDTPLASLCHEIRIAPLPTRSTLHRAWTTVFSSAPDMALRLYSHEMNALVGSTFQDGDYQLAQVEGIEMAPYVLNLASKTPWIFDDHNAEYVLQRTAFESDIHNPRRWHGAIYSQIQWRKLAAFERRACSDARHVLAASGTDCRALQDLGVTTPVSVIPNGVDTDHFVPSVEVCARPLADLGMVYAGKMDFRPNVDAVNWFAREILPRIRSQVPLAHLTIVGQRPTPAVRDLATLSGVTVTGWVPDTRPFVADAAVYVVPLRMGSGTRLKVLEAMAMGKAIVSTRRGVEGIDIEPGNHALVADRSDDFAATVVALLSDKDRRIALGQAARAQAMKYDWRNIVPRLLELYDDLDRQAP